MQETKREGIASAQPSYSIPKAGLLPSLFLTAGSMEGSRSK